MAKNKRQIELAAVVMYICHTARKFSAVFLVLGVLALLFLSPGEVERGLYVFIIAANAAVFGGSYLLEGFMKRSERDFQEKTGAKREDKSGIDGWLAKKDAEKDK